MTKLSPKCIRILKTCNLYFSFFFLGLSIALPGPCLLDLQRMVQTDTERVGMIYTARSVGLVLGSIVGGILLDLTEYKQAVLGISNGIAAAAMLVVPWTRSLGFLTGCMVAVGLSLCIVHNGCNVLCLTLWGNESGPYFQALHLTFGLGAFLSPMIAAPFLQTVSEDIIIPLEENVTIHSDDLINFTNQSIGHIQFASMDDAPTIVYPFSFVGGLGLLVTVAFLAVCIIAPVEEVASKSEDKEDDKTSVILIYFLVILCSVFLFVETGAEIGYAQLVTAYVVLSPLHLSSSTGSYIASAFWGSLSIARVAAVFISIRVSNFSMIVFNMVISLLGSLVLLFLASYEWAIWLASVLLGIGVSSLIPAVVAWLGSYINLTNKRASIIFGNLILGEMLVPAVISYFIETVPDVLIYTVVVSTAVCCVIVFILYLILNKIGEKNKAPECSIVSVTRIIYN